jgi:hypothetical protein
MPGRGAGQGPPAVQGRAPPKRPMVGGRNKSADRLRAGARERQMEEAAGPVERAVQQPVAGEGTAVHVPCRAGCGVQGFMTCEGQGHALCTGGHGWRCPSHGWRCTVGGARLAVHGWRCPSHGWARMVNNKGH